MAPCRFEVGEDELSIHYVIRCEVHGDHFKSKDPDQIMIWQSHHLELQRLIPASTNSPLLVAGISFILIAIVIIVLMS